MKTAKEIKQTVKISDLIKHEKIKFIQEGNSIKIQCLFHDDNTASMSCKDFEGFFFCFGCGKSGDILNVVEQLYPNMRFPERIKYLENIKTTNNGVGVSISSNNILARAIVRNVLYYEVLGFICNYFQEQLSTGIKNKYLIGKDIIKYTTHDGEVTMNGYGFKDSSIIKYRIGFSPNNKKLYNLLIGKYGIDKLKQFYIGNKLLGIFSSNGIPLFKDRIVFPIMIGNKIVSMIARQTEYTPRDKYSTGKYTAMIGDKNHIYNECNLSKSTLFITEGITDCISLKEHGFNSVALITTSLKKSMEERILKKLEGSNVFILFDTEINESGKKGAVKLSKLLNQHGINNTIITLPLESGETKIDINKYFTKHTKTDFMKLLGNQII